MTQPFRLIPRFVALMAFAAGCGDALVFDLEAKVDEFTVPGDPHLNHEGTPLDKLAIPPIEIELGAIQARSIKLSGLRFYVTETSIGPGADQDALDFFEEVRVKAVSLDPSANLPVIQLAHWQGPAPPGATEIPLVVDGDHDLQPYLTTGLSLHIETAGTVPYDDVSIMGDAQFRVDPI